MLQYRMLGAHGGRGAAWVFYHGTKAQHSGSVRREGAATYMIRKENPRFKLGWLCKTVVHIVHWGCVVPLPGPQTSLGLGLFVLNPGLLKSLKLLCPILKCCFNVFKSSEAKKDPSHSEILPASKSIAKVKWPQFSHWHDSDWKVPTPSGLSPDRSPLLTVGESPALSVAPEDLFRFYFFNVRDWLAGGRRWVILSRLP